MGISKTAHKAVAVLREGARVMDSDLYTVNITAFYWPNHTSRPIVSKGIENLIPSLDGRSHGAILETVNKEQKTEATKSSTNIPNISCQNLNNAFVTVI